MIKKEHIKYIDGDERNGVEYDWPKIYKEYGKLKTPRDTFDPRTAPVTLADILMYVSKRSKGKTTNWLLIGMIMYLMYGTRIPYIRTDKAMIKPKTANEIFNVIKTFRDGWYIKDMTGGKFNNIYYKWGKMYLCFIDENGVRTDTDAEPFFYFLSIDQHELYKSTLNIPMGDLIIVDEYIEESGRISDFVNFWDLFRTIQRDRLSVKVIFLANTTDPNNIWFRDFCISSEVKSVKPGEHKLIDVNGTKIFFEYIDLKLSERTVKMISKYFGFAKGNPRMAHLVETEAPWSFKPVPHINYEDSDKYLDRTVRIRANDLETLQVELVEKKNGILCCYVHPCTIDYDDSIFLTLSDIKEPDEYWGLGHGKYFDFLWKLYQRNLWYYSDNETGALVESYVKNYRQLKK